MEPKRKKPIIIIISLSLVMVVAIIIPVSLILVKLPFNTTELGQISTGGEAHELEIQGDIAYVVVGMPHYIFMVLL